jgi:16S rRNA (adenine1518-N6/adenine1519-N6)-dimethyltransferase
MGQNFLVDENVLAKIVAAADLKSSDTVLEVGPGLGVLTWELVARAGKVLALEKDDLLAKLLVQNSKIKVQNDNAKLKIINTDALEFDPESYQLTAGSYKLVANIPYNITSLIIRKFLEEQNKPQLMILMVQKEVAERITAKPGDMSLLSVSVQFYAEAEIVSLVKNTSFFPIPKVDSAILKISNFHPTVSFAVSDFFRVVRFGFVAKRKTLGNNLSAGMHITKEAAADIIKRAGLEAKIRAEALSVGDWVKLYEIVRTLTLQH